MKYGYEGADCSKLIKKYEISDNKIIITYLDGSVYTMPYSIENEKDILDLMLEQAKDRSKATTIFRQNSFGKHMLSLGAISSAGAISYFLGMSVIDMPSAKACCAAAGVALSACSLVEGAISLRYFDQIKELEKYDIYLSIREDIKLANKKKLFKGINKECNLYINTLDNFSLRDLKKIKKNLKSSIDFGYYIDYDRVYSLKK